MVSNLCTETAELRGDKLDVFRNSIKQQETAYNDKYLQETH